VKTRPVNAKSGERFCWKKDGWPGLFWRRAISPEYRKDTQEQESIATVMSY